MSYDVDGADRGVPMSEWADVESMYQAESAAVIDVTEELCRLLTGQTTLSVAMAAAMAHVLGARLDIQVVRDA